MWRHCSIALTSALCGAIVLVVMGTAFGHVGGQAANSARLRANEATKQDSADASREVTWQDPPAKNAGAASDRPGNYGALAAIHDFLSGLHAVRPKMRSAAAPFFLDGSVIEELSKFDELIKNQEKKAAAEGVSPENSARRYNWMVSSVEFFALDSNGDPGLLQFAQGEKLRKRLDVCRASHGGGILVRLKLKKVLVVDGSSMDTEDWLFLKRQQEGWVVCWYER